jgi:hypothetical protein
MRQQRDRRGKYRTSAAPRERQKFPDRCMTALGHEGRLASPKLSAGCGFRKETIAGKRRNGQVA